MKPWSPSPERSDRGGESPHARPYPANASAATSDRRGVAWLADFIGLSNDPARCHQGNARSDEVPASVPSMRHPWPRSHEQVRCRLEAAEVMTKIDSIGSRKPRTQQTTAARSPGTMLTPSLASAAGPSQSTAPLNHVSYAPPQLILAPLLCRPTPLHPSERFASRFSSLMGRHRIEDSPSPSSVPETSRIPSMAIRPNAPQLRLRAARRSSIPANG